MISVSAKARCRFVGGLIVAGALTFLPGRLMWAIFFS